MAAEPHDDELTIGELAGAAGATVRAIRHYEEIGLLTASERSFGGHRRYRRAELRLRRILILRRCGFGLEAIRHLLAAESREEALAMARRQLERADLELEVARRLRLRVRRFTELLAGPGGGSIDQLIAEIEEEDMTEHLDPITTGLGDSGETDLADGSRVAKTHPLIAAAGEVEALLAEVSRVLAETEPQPTHRAWLERIAHELLDLCCDLAAPASSEDGPRIDAGYVEWLERASREAGAGLDQLDTFVAIFPTPAAAGLNACRTTCRRAELAVFAVEDANPQIGRYLNRLSDLLFLVARAEAGGGEVRWRPGRSIARA